MKKILRFQSIWKNNSFQMNYLDILAQNQVPKLSKMKTKITYFYSIQKLHRNVVKILNLVYQKSTSNSVLLDNDPLAHASFTNGIDLEDSKMELLIDNMEYQKVPNVKTDEYTNVLVNYDNACSSEKYFVVEESDSELNIVTHVHSFSIDSKLSNQEKNDDQNGSLEIKPIKKIIVSAEDIADLETEKQKEELKAHSKKIINILQDISLSNLNTDHYDEGKNSSDPILSDSSTEPYCDSGSEYLPSDREDVPEKFMRTKCRKQIQRKSTLEENIEAMKPSFENSVYSNSEIVEKLQNTTSSCSKFTVPDKNLNVNISLDVAEMKDNKRIYDKTHCCYICHQKCLKMARHLELKHQNELAVAQIFVKEKKSSERRKSFLELIRVGDFYHNMEVLSSKTGQLILCRRPSAICGRLLSYNDFGPCPYCLGFMNKSLLTRYVKACTSHRSENPNTKKSVRVASNALVNSMLFNGDSKFRSFILDTLCHDEISEICKTDNVILGVGMQLFEKHSNSQKELIKQSMRQLARLLQVIRESDSEFANKKLEYFIDLTYFDIEVNSVKTSCKANFSSSEKMEYDIPSLALKIGHNLRKSVGFLRGQALRAGEFQEDKKLSSFLQLLDLEWEVRISSNALSTLTKRKINSSSLLPLTQDLLKLNEHIMKEIEIFKVLLQNNSCETTAWLRLAQLTLTRIILFNKRRAGEMSRMTIKQYSSCPDWSKESTVELQDSLTSFEKELANSMKLIQIPGKRGRTVPVLLREEMVSSINLLISTRMSAGINSSNSYIFARSHKDSMSYIRGPDALRLIVENAGLSSPKSITSTKLRKYTATVCQVFNLQEREVDWLARHMGHDVRVHRDFYRLHESAVELTKISRILMAIDSGEVSKFKGQSLDGINLQDLPDITDSADESDEEDKPDEEEDILSIGTSRQSNKTKKNSSTNDDEPIKKKRKGHRPWTQNEKIAVTNFFRVAIKKKIVPGKVMCEECIRNSGEVLNQRRWTDIKYYIKNYITKLNKIARAPTPH
nr:uncharacterized protein LOC111508612 [Leptinotarsa decemlineata]